MVIQSVNWDRYKSVANLSKCDSDDLAGVFDYIYGSKTEADTSGDETKYTISYDESLFSKDFFDGD